METFNCHNNLSCIKNVILTLIHFARNLALTNEMSPYPNKIKSKLKTWSGYVSQTILKIFYFVK